jgi:group I intron endonuclease
MYMHYLIYKVTNKVNNKIYVGKHKTNDKNDSYLGSGAIIKRAVTKYGKDAFQKEILYECENEDAMNRREAEIVDEEFIARQDTYNIKLGGNGGWDFINKNALFNGVKHRAAARENIKKASKGYKIWFKSLSTDEREEYMVKRMLGIRLFQETHGGTFKGKSHSDLTKEKMRKARLGKVSGKDNPSYGTMWITNGVDNKKIHRDTTIAVGWKKGRIIK